MVRVRKPQYAGETQLASFCKLFDIHIYPAHNYQLSQATGDSLGTPIRDIFSPTIQLSRKKKKDINMMPADLALELHAALISGRRLSRPESPRCAKYDEMFRHESNMQ